MRVTKVLICTDEDKWLECYAEGGMTSGYITPAGDWVQNTKMSDTDAVLVGMAACPVVLRSIEKLVGVQQ